MGNLMLPVSTRKKKDLTKILTRLSDGLKEVKYAEIISFRQVGLCTQIHLVPIIAAGKKKHHFNVKL